MKTFKELDLIAPVQRAIADQKYTTPTPIQAQTIPSALKGSDILGSAQTGTGKTAAFALPILDRLGRQKRAASPNRPLALILAPTRELAIQIGESFETYGKQLRLRHALVYGGVSQHRQVKALSRGAHILVATPGRLLDLMNQGHIDLRDLEVFVLDEVDRMLDMGFLPDLKRIIQHLPKQRQSLFFSATLPPKIVELANRLLRKPVRVNISPESPSVDKIEQRVYFVGRSGKQQLLQKIVDSADVEQVLVFTRTKRNANAVAAKLCKVGIEAVAIHGNKSQNARQRALTAFQKKKVNVLVATDVASRGIDIDDVTHVVNYDLPTEPECYVHRIGRTGRAGRVGVALSFCSDTERDDLHAIEKFIGKRLDGDQPRKPARSQASQPPAGRGRAGERAANSKSANGGDPAKRRRRRRGQGKRVPQTA